MISLKVKLEESGFELDDLSSGAQETLIAAVGAVARAARDEWTRLAQNRLRTGREIYINGLRQAGSFIEKDSGREKTYEITLVGKMPNNFEFGMASFDMKTVRPGWLYSSKTKISKSGKRYRIIPFRHSQTSPARLAYSGKAREVNLQATLKKIVRKYSMDQMVTTSGGRAVEGMVKRVPNLKKTGKIARVFDKASHHPLSGLTRIQKNYPGGPQGHLMTFRVMSEDAVGKWIHPGIKAANLLPEVQAWADAEMDRIIASVAGGT